MNIAVDFGNTIAKVGIFKDEILQQHYFFNTPESLRHFLTAQEAGNIIVSSVSHPATEVLAWSGAHGKKIALSPATPVPVKIAYRTPETLGVDRIAAVCGALAQYPGEPCLVIDAGTCITYEFLDAAGVYHGGSISPGVKMRFRAMHEFTARLPLAAPVSDAPLTGDSTETCLQSGVVNGIRAEARGIIQQYKMRAPGLHILICGGDAGFFENPENGIIFVPELVLNGLNGILLHGLAV